MHLKGQMNRLKIYSYTNTSSLSALLARSAIFMETYWAFSNTHSALNDILITELNCILNISYAKVVPAYSLMTAGIFE